MRLDESSIFRIGLVALALSHWKQASVLVSAGLMPLRPAAVGFVIVLYVTSFALLLASVVRIDPKRFGRWVFVSFATLFAAYTYRDAMRKALSETMPTTDGHIYMDIAARMLLKGMNPYAQSLADAFRVYRMPLALSTPLLDGDISDRVAYPSLSVLVLVPFVLLHVPTYLAYAACFIAALGLLVWKAPWWARPLVLSLFTMDDTFLGFSYGGVTDTVWMLCLVGAVFAWRRPALAAVLVGLACAHKQHPWFLVPYLVVRLCDEHGQRPWRGAPRRFLLTVGAVFLALDLPFFLWGPKSWLLGVFEPLVAPMIQLSEGLTALGMTGYVVMPRLGLTLLFWSVYASSIALYARHARVLRDLCWVLPGVVLWFGYRALMSYWYFYALTGVAALLARYAADGDAADDVGAPDPPWQPTAIAGAVLGTAIAGFIAWSSLRPPPFAVTVLGPMDTWETRVFRLRFLVENRTSHGVRPRFAVQSGGLQPLAWTVDFGPPRLARGQSGEYVVRAPRGFNEFEVSEGARIAVSDDGDPGVRTFVSVPPDRTTRHLDTVPNGRFAYMETRNYLPLGWSFDKSDAGVSVRLAPDLERRDRITMTFAPSTQQAAPPPQLAACVIGQRLDVVPTGARYADLVATFALPESDLIFDVQPPEHANAPPYQLLYGLRVAVQNWRGFVLFGDDVREGKLPTGEPFTSLAVKRGEWSTVRISIRSVLEALHAPLHERRFRYVRAPDTDVPSVPLELGLYASVPAETSASFVFGAVQQVTFRPIDELLARGEQSKVGLAAWHAAFEMENGNFGKAADMFEKAVLAEPTAERLRLLGDAQLLNGQPSLARASYMRALEATSSPEANKGMGWSLVAMGDPAAAIPYLERAKSEFADREKVAPRPGVLDTLRGLAVASAKKGDCDAARRYAAELVAEDPALPAPPLEGCE